MKIPVRAKGAGWRGAVLGGLLSAEMALGAAAEPARLVSLAPNLTELVFALGFGDALVGRSSVCDTPPDALRIPVAGAFGRPNREALLTLRPDVVLVTDLEQPGWIARLRAEGMEVLQLPCEGWAELMAAARAIGRAAGKPEAGEAWVAAQEKRQAALADRVEQYWNGRVRPLVYLEVWGDPPTTAGGQTFLDEVITLAGGRNIAGDLPRRYTPVNSEWVIAKDPEAIVAAYMSGTNTAAFERRPGWSAIRAVRDGRVCRSIPADWLLRPGPRLLDGAEALADWLMAEDVERK